MNVYLKGSVKLLLLIFIVTIYSPILILLFILELPTLLKILGSGDYYETWICYFVERLIENYLSW